MSVSTNGIPTIFGNYSNVLCIFDTILKTAILILL